MADCVGFTLFISPSSVATFAGFCFFGEFGLLCFLCFKAPGLCKLLPGVFNSIRLADRHVFSDAFVADYELLHRGNMVSFVEAASSKSGSLFKGISSRTLAACSQKNCLRGLVCISHST